MPWCEKQTSCARRLVDRSGRRTNLAMQMPRMVSSQARVVDTYVPHMLSKGVYKAERQWIYYEKFAQIDVANEQIEVDGKNQGLWHEIRKAGCFHSHEGLPSHLTQLAVFLFQAEQLLLCLCKLSALSSAAFVLFRLL